MTYIVVDQNDSQYKGNLINKIMLARTSSKLSKRSTRNSDGETLNF